MQTSVRGLTELHLNEFLVLSSVGDNLLGSTNLADDVSATILGWMVLPITHSSCRLEIPTGPEVLGVWTSKPHSVMKYE